MKKPSLLFVLFSAVIGLARGDPNIYGPGGINLGPDGDLPPSYQEVQLNMLLEEEREKTRLLEEQVQELQQQVEQLQQIQRQQETVQYPVQIDINYGYPQQNSGWIWGGPFVGGGFNSGFNRVPRIHKHHKRGMHHGKGSKQGKGGHHHKGGRGSPRN